MLTTAFARSSYDVYTFRTYPAKSGRTRDVPGAGQRCNVLSQGQEADILITFNEEAYQLHGKTIKPHGLLVYDPPTTSPKAPLNPTRCRSMKSL